MKKNKIYSCNFEVSQLGLGTVKFGRNEEVKYPHAFKLPTDAEIIDLLTFAYDNGINLLDTAPAYGNSEERIGKLLRSDRKKWIISTKVGEEFSNGTSTYDYSSKHINFSIERSLKRLNTDYLDIVLIHSNGDDKKIIENDSVFQTLEKIKERGLIRAYGMSTKTVEGGLLTLKYSDIAMVTYNVINTEEEIVIKEAEKNNKNTFIKKALASGHLDKFNSNNPVHDAFEFILKTPGVSSIIIGTLSKQHLQHNIDCIKSIQR